MTAAAEHLQPVIETCLAELGLDLDSLLVRTTGKNRLVRVAVDADGGVGIDNITDATRVLSAVLDADPAMGEQPYTLEVSSRGVDEPLTLPRHWRRNSGRVVRVTTHADETFEGRIGDSDDTGAELVTKASRRRIEFDDVARAVISIELNPRKDI